MSKAGGGIDEHQIPLASAAARVAICYRRDRLAAEKMNTLDRHSAKHALDHEPKLTGVHFGNEHGARLRGGLAQRLFGERPERDRTEQPHAQPLRSAQLDGARRRAGADADGDDDHVGVVAAQRFPGVDHVAVPLQLGKKPRQVAGDRLRVLGREAVFAMGQAGRMRAIARARPRHGRNAVAVGRHRACRPQRGPLAHLRSVRLELAAPSSATVSESCAITWS